MLQGLYSKDLPNSLCGPIILDAAHIPRYWGTIWALYSTSGLSFSTKLKKLRYLEELYQFTDNMKDIGSLDDAIASVDIKILGEMLEAYFISIQNRQAISENSQKKWLTAIQFIKEIITRLSKSNLPLDKIREIEIRLQRLNNLYQQLRIGKRRTQDPARALPANVVQTLFGMLDPTSSINPFKNNSSKWRVFIVFIVLLHLGLRRGELLLLTSDAVKTRIDTVTGENKYWVNIQENQKYRDDVRHSKPSIKTAHSIRQIPISELTANLIKEYVENYRGKPDHPYLLNSQQNKPLSIEAVTKYFARISNALPEDAKHELNTRTGRMSISAHMLRHTCAVIRLNQLLDLDTSMDESLQKMRSFFGWSRTSDMPRKYAKAVFEDRLATVWNNAFDERVSLVRAIPKSII